MDEEKKSNREHIEDWRQWHNEDMKNWRAWGSWFSWGSPVGLGLFFVEIAGFLWILHMAGLIK